MGPAQRILSLEPFPADKPNIQGKPGREGILSRALPPSAPPAPQGSLAIPSIVSGALRDFLIKVNFLLS